MLSSIIVNERFAIDFETSDSIDCAFEIAARGSISETILLIPGVSVMGSDDRVRTTRLVPVSGP